MNDQWGLETWTYAGLRVGRNGKRLHAWAEPDGSEYLYDDKGSAWVMGGLYEVEVQRDAEHVTRKTPKYTGNRAEAGTVQRYRVADEAARITLAELALIRSHAKHESLDQVLEPVRDLARGLRSAEREAFAQMLMRAVYSA